MAKKRKIIRQGDVLLLPIAEANVPQLKRHTEEILARGEATGHHHTLINGEVLVDEKGRLFVRATNATELRHTTQTGAKADHDLLKVEPGLYEVRIEEDYEPDGLRKVID